MWILACFVIAADTSADLRVPVARAESIAVSVTGGGRPVVLVPGLFGSRFGFRHVISLLATAGYRVIVIEPLGVGSSARPDNGDYSLTAQADRIAAVLDTLRVRDAVVVAHSLGASMAYRLAYRRPELVHAIVSLEGGPAESAATPSFRRAMRFVPWIKWFGGMRRIRGAIHATLVAASGDTSWVTDSVVNAYTAGAAVDLDATLKAFLRMAEAREPEPLGPHLGAIRCPVRLLVGTARHASGVPAGDVAKLVAGLPSFTIDSVPGSGHYIYEERPQAVLDAVVASARLLPVASGRSESPSARTPLTPSAAPR